MGDDEIIVGEKGFGKMAGCVRKVSEVSVWFGDKAEDGALSRGEVKKFRVD